MHGPINIRFTNPHYHYNSAVFIRPHRQTNPVHTITSYLFKIRFNIIVPSNSRYSQWTSCFKPKSYTYYPTCHSKPKSVALPCKVTILNTHVQMPGCWNVLSPTRKETSSEACQGRARFQQHRDASCYQVPPPTPARQGDEGNSRHSDRNISLFPSCSG